MEETSKEVVITLIAGTVLLLFLVVIVIIAVVRYQNRNRQHSMEMQRLKHEAEQELLKSQLEVQEEALNNLSREIHDNIGQILNSAKMLVGIQLYNNNQPDSILNEAEKLISISIDELRSLSKSMNSSWLEQFNIVENLESEARRINRSGKIQLSVQPTCGIDLAKEKQLMLFRLTQEAFQNAIKHSQATHIIISVSESEHVISLTISDDGIGFDVHDPSTHGFGILNMKNRASLMGGTINWSSGSTGTVVTIQIPKQHAISVKS